MSLGHCSCPDCGTTLRIRDRSFVGRQVDCPECHAKLVIALDAERNLVAERPKPEEAKKAAAPKLVAPVVKAGSSVGRKFGDMLRSPLVIAWALGVGITAFVAIMMLRPNVRFRPPSKEPPATVANQTDPKPTANDKKVGPDEVTPDNSSPPVDPVTPPSDTVAANPATDVKPADAAIVENVATTPPVKPEDPPPQRPIVVPVVKIQVEELFKQPIKGFSTAKPLSRKLLIEQIEELLGAPIRYNSEELGEKNLERTMSITLEATTVGGILKVVLESAGWDYIVEDDGIRLKPRRVAEKE